MQVLSILLGEIVLTGIWQNCDVEFQLFGIRQQGGVGVDVWACPCISLTAVACHWSRTMHRGWDGRAETHGALTAQRKKFWDGFESLPPLPAWPETSGTLICLMILFRVLGGSCGASFGRLKEPVSIVSPSTFYLMQQKVEDQVSPCPMCLWVHFPIAFPATGGFYSTEILFFFFLYN